MQRIDGQVSDAVDCQLNEQPKVNSGAPEFALVQNYFVYGAAEEKCEDKKSSACESKAAKQDLVEHQYFRNLRTVLPIYYGRIQVVTTDTAQNRQGKNIETLQDLTGEPVYLGSGVNSTHGMEVLSRHPMVYAAIEGNVISGSAARNEIRRRFVDRLTHTYDETVAARVRELLAGDFCKEKLGKRKEYAANATTLVQEMPLAATQRMEVAEKLVAFCELPTGHRDISNRLLACGIAKAYVISGELISEDRLALSDVMSEACPISESGLLRLEQIPIDEVIVNAMVNDQPYYQKVSPPALLPEFESAMPAVTTYLVTSSDTKPDVVRRLTSALEDDWSNLTILFADLLELVPLSETIYKQPARYHAGARRALADAGLLGEELLLTWQAALFFLVLTMVMTYFLWNVGLGYNRLGDPRMGESQHKWELGRLFIRLILVFFITYLIFTIVVLAIGYFEYDQAAGQGTNNPIASLEFPQILLWMFTFISSGFENNIFPQSTESILLVSLFAIGGVALPIYFIVKIIDRGREKQLDFARGVMYRGLFRRIWDRIMSTLRLGYRRHGILLLCGWNQKAPGLIYSLTCSGSPYPGIVNIVADMDVDFPVRHWNFNKRRVFFYRGDPSHRPTLNRAEVARSGNALILADYDAQTGSNSSGVLTAMALQKIKSERDDGQFFVAAELTLKDRDRRFSSQDFRLDDVVDPRVIARQMISISCFEPPVQDFVLDALSPDDFCEWYAYPADVLHKRFLNVIEDRTVRDYCQSLFKRGIHVVGVCPKDPSDIAELFSPDFNDRTYLDPLISETSLDKKVSAGSYIVCAAHHNRSFKRFSIRGRSMMPDTEAVFGSSNVSILSAAPDRARMLIIGHEDQARSLASYLEDSFKFTSTKTISTDRPSEDEIDESIVSALADGTWTHIILLSSVPDSRSSAEYDRNSRHADSATILRASLINKEFGGNATDVVVVAEVNNTHSRQLAMDANVTTVVPTSLLVERMLARLISERGHVAEMLSAMLSTRDGIYLRSIELDVDHPLVGQEVGRVMTTWYSDGRVLGVRPQTEKERLRNASDDFDWHFIMGPEKDTMFNRLRAGDVLIVLSYPPKKDTVQVTERITQPSTEKGISL